MKLCKECQKPLDPKTPRLSLVKFHDWRCKAAWDARVKRQGKPPADPEVAALAEDIEALATAAPPKKRAEDPMEIQRWRRGAAKKIATDNGYDNVAQLLRAYGIERSQFDRKIKVGHKGKASGHHHVDAEGKTLTEKLEDAGLLEIMKAKAQDEEE